MYSKMKNNFKWFIVTLILALFGCASIEHKIELLSLGAATNEVEEILKDTKYNVVERKIEPYGTIEVRRYSSYSEAWNLTFKDGKLTGWERSLRHIMPIQGLASGLDLKG